MQAPWTNYQNKILNQVIGKKKWSEKDGNEDQLTIYKQERGRTPCSPLCFEHLNKGKNQTYLKDRQLQEDPYLLLPDSCRNNSQVRSERSTNEERE